MHNVPCRLITFHYICKCSFTSTDMFVFDAMFTFNLSVSLIVVFMS